MSFDFLIKQREQRLRGILRVSPCENIAPHDANTCTACCAVAAERFLVSAVEADFQRQVSAGLKKSPPHTSDPFPGTNRLAELHERLSKFVPKDGPSTQTTIDYLEK
jgi:hypothetical protein